MKREIQAKTSAKIEQDSIAAMEPLLIPDSSKHKPGLRDLALELSSRSSGLRRSLPAGMTAALADLVRSMNCYYSNLIEGHNTHPIDIEKALRADYSGNKQKRDLQREARAHVAVQKWIDDDGLKGRVYTADGLREVHRRFYAHLPEDLLAVEDPVTGKHLHLIPGEFRTRGVKVGQHIPVAPKAIPAFLKRFEEVYGTLGKAEVVVAAAAAHHRFAWIHPFLDGNGRVGRLMSHAALLETLDTGALWSISRGLARSEGVYKGHLAACDLPRRNDLDGRGALSLEALIAFSVYFLQTCLDQVAFMERLMQPDRLRERIRLWAEEEMRADALPAKSDRILTEVLYRGEVPRGEIAGIVGLPERTARRPLSALVEKGVLVSDTPKSPVRIAFPAALAGRWMPGLFPDQ